MLALADWCDDRGGSLYPSIKAVADKVRVGEKHARNILHKFEHERYLAVVGNHFGGKPGTTREYRLNVGKLKVLADDANAKKEAEKAAKYGAKKASGDQWEDVFATAPPEVTPYLQFPDGSPVGDKTAPPEVTLSPIEPPIEPPIKNNKARQCVLPDDFTPNATGQALSAELGMDWTRELAAFTDHHAANGSTFIDWQAAFRTWVRKAATFAKRDQRNAPARTFTPINKQEALEARNREVARKWAAGE
jgi:hypothetical protein